MDDCFDFVRAQTRFASLSPFFALVLRPFRRRNGCGQLLRGHLWIPKLGLPAPHIPTSDPTKFQDPQLSPPLLTFTRRAVDRVILPWPGYRQSAEKPSFLKWGGVNAFGRWMMTALGATGLLPLSLSPRRP